MACVNCCSSRSDLVDKILEQGQRLRNAMVQSILNNDPFNADVIHCAREPLKLEGLARETNEKITAFLKGDQMDRRDEVEALETLRSMSASDLCKTTDRTYKSEYKSDRSSSRKSETARDRSNEALLKYVDSLKVTVQSLSLNEAGRKKVAGSLEDRKSVTQTYFLEYQIPDVLRTMQRSKSKVDTGLDSNGNVRMCARSSYHQVPIPFKQVSIHDVSNLDSADMDELALNFRLCFRGARQKQPNLLGHASFKFSSLETARKLSSSQELSVKLNETTPLVVGSLKVSVQLGCGRLYFGKEFIEAMCNKRVENSILESPVDWIPEKLKPNKETAKALVALPEMPKQVLFGFIYISEAQFSRELQNSYLTCQSFGQDDRLYSKVVEFDANPLYNFFQQIPLVHEEELLAKLRDNFMVVEFYEKEDNKDFVVGLTKLPLHQFYLAFRNQVVVKYLAEKKYPIITCDGWEPISNPFDGDVVGQVQVLLALGTKEQIETLELDRGFKNSIVKAKTNLPPPSPIPKTSVKAKSVTKPNTPTNPNTPRKQKITTRHEAAPIPAKKKHLTTEIASHISITDNRPAIIVPSTSSVDIATQAQYDTPKTSPKRKLKSTTLQQYSSPKSVRFEEKVDVGIQCEKMEDNKKDESQQEPQRGNPQSIENLLNQLMAPFAPPPEFASLSSKPAAPAAEQHQFPKPSLDLTALGFPDVSRDVSKYFEESTATTAAAAAAATRIRNRPKSTFRAHVFIEKAMHLPFRKKCRSRKNRGRKHIDEKLQQESMPCTYVTFEVSSDREVKATPVCGKPEWNYRCDVDLNVDLLRDKHLVFKVWRKPATGKLNNSTNQQPNVQTDVVVGFASVDLSALASGLPSIQGWYNILDFSGKIQGQINIHVTPLENVVRHDLAASKLRPLQIDTQLSSPTSESGPSSSCSDPVTPDEPGELLGRALKRKFTELDEITQRLRLRLSKVTNDESDASNDEVADAFERDINTLCVEDDYDTLSFEDDASASKDCQVSLLRYSDGTAETHQQKQCLLESKQKIDSLLEKLSLISGENSRYVSGCSASASAGNDAGNILEELNKHSRPSLYSVPTFDAAMRQKFGDDVVSDSYTDFSDDCRKAPEGEGKSSDDTSAASKSTTTE